MSDSIDSRREAIPDTLREREQWVCWREEERDGKPTKIPVTPGTGEFASSTDAETWTSFERAVEYTETGTADGVGFVFTDEDPIVGVDLDDCRDPESGDVDDVATDIIERLDSFTEISPSGTGFHVLIKGELPAGRNRRGSIELYDTARFFTVTGNRVEGTPAGVARRQDALAAIHREYVEDTTSDTAATAAQQETTNKHTEVKRTEDNNVDLSDEELLEKARNASNGAKFDRLWNGNIAGYDSQSEADMALCCLLAFWTGGDQTQMDQLFRQSGLCREKWDEVHYADGSTYGEKTVERAIAQTSEFYEPDGGDESTQVSGTSDDARGDIEQGDSERSRAYLSEKNQLLAERVDELEASLEQKNERIDALEAEVERLNDALAGQDSDTEPTPETDDDAAENEPGGETTSVWDRTKRLFESDSE